MTEKLTDKAKQKESCGDYPHHPVQDKTIESKKNSESDFDIEKKESQAVSLKNPLQQFGMNVPMTMSNDRMKDLMGQFPTNTGIPDIKTPPMGMNNPPKISKEEMEEIRGLKNEMEKIGPGPYSDVDEGKIAEIPKKIMAITSKMNIEKRVEKGLNEINFEE